MATGKNGSSPKQKKKHSFLKFFLKTILLLLLLASAALSVAVAVYVSRISQSLPSDEEILSYQANEASIVYDRKNRVITKLFIENRRPVQLSEVSNWMVMAILAAEDSEFYSHHGIRPLAILRSLLTGDRGQGASTITQQLARNLFLSSEKTLERKAKEALIALKLEKLYSKDKLIETYLNAIYFGHGAFGIDAAAHSYFSKSAAKLTLGEASILAGLVAAPEKYSPLRHLDLARTRQNYVLRRMVHLGWATEEQAQAAAAEKLKFNEKTIESKQSFDNAPYFVSHILFKELIPKYSSDLVYKSGMKIYTTLDLDLQAAAEEAMKKLKSEGALVALDPSTGAVLAMVGGKDFEKTKFNRATQAYRQVGSAFKPIVYVTALESGLRPIDHIMDAPIAFDDTGSGKIWEPHNFSPEYAGEETLLTALARSHNTPAARLTAMLGPQEVVNTARRMGITSPYLPAVLSVGLGVASVTPLEVSAVYSVFANGGARITPYFISEIRNSDEKVIFSALPSQEEALKPDIALMARAMLQEVTRAGTGARARMSECQTFGKTGTSNDFADAWFAGGIPGLVAVVFAGNDDLKPLGAKGATGSQIALPVWSAFMKQAVKILQPPRDFSDVETSLERVKICVESGYPASPACPKTATVFLPQERVPMALCPLHGGTSVDDDPNAPQLFLLPEDKAEWDENNAPSPNVQPASQDNIDVSVPETRISGDMSVNTPDELPDTSSGSWRDLIKKDNRSVEERYQELLKKYNIQ
jgi:penicillin-binding protein 1A